MSHEKKIGSLPKWSFLKMLVSLPSGWKEGDDACQENKKIRVGCSETRIACRDKTDNSMRTQDATANATRHHTRIRRVSGGPTKVTASALDLSP